MPLKIYSDQGSAFVSDAFKKFAQQHKIELLTAPAYHPQANGLVERFHRRLKESLMAKGNKNWLQSLPWTLLGIRNSKGPDIPYSPCEALFGENTRTPNTVEESKQPMCLEHFTLNQTQCPKPPPAAGRWHNKNLQNNKPLPPIKADYVLIRRLQKKPLQFPYAGPFKLLTSDKTTATVSYWDKPLTVARDRIKPFRPHNGKIFFKTKNDDNLV